VNSILSHLQSSDDHSSLQLSVVNGEDDARNNHGGTIVARALFKAGVRYVFTLSGGHISPILVGCKREGIRVIDVRDEVTAVFAADATSRMTGIPGVAIVTAGPGLTNTITAVKNAQMAESPLILFGGATAMILKGRGSLQDIDQDALMRPHCKRVSLIKSVDSIWEQLQIGFETALSDTPGPVFFEFPLEVLYPKAMMQAQVMGKTESPPFSLNPAQIRAKVQHWYLQRHMDSVYGSGEVIDKAQDRFAYKIYRIPAVPSLVRKGYNALVSAKRPMFLIGSQAIRAGETDDIIRSLERIGAVVYLSGMARGLLGASHPLQMRHKRGESLQKADCVFIVGVALDFRLSYGRSVGKSTFLAMVNLNADTLQKNRDIRDRQLSVLADPVNYMRELSALWASKNPTVDYSEWIKECAGRDAERNQQIARMSADQSSGTGVNPLYLFNHINQVIDEDSVIVADGGDFVGTASYTLFPRRPLSWLDPGAFGTLGVGGGMALAAKLARPSAEVWLIYGDGSSAYSLAEIDTCVRHGLPIIAVIGNDAAWMQILRDQLPTLGDSVACTLRPGTRYDVVAQGYGGEGILINSPDEVPSAIAKAKELARQGIPVVVNCILQKSSFREGSISV